MDKGRVDDKDLNSIAYPFHEGSQLAIGYLQLVIRFSKQILLSPVFKPVASFQAPVAYK